MFLVEKVDCDSNDFIPASSLQRADSDCILLIAVAFLENRKVKISPKICNGGGAMYIYCVLWCIIASFIINYNMKVGQKSKIEVLRKE